MDNNLTNRESTVHRKALVTGGSSGIGYSLVKKFCQENIATAFADIEPSEFIPKEAHFFDIDITIADDIQVLYKEVREIMGPPTFLFAMLAGASMKCFRKETLNFG